MHIVQETLKIQCEVPAQKTTRHIQANILVTREEEKECISLKQHCKSYVWSLPKGVPGTCMQTFWSLEKRKGVHIVQETLKVLREVPAQKSIRHIQGNILVTREEKRSAYRSRNTESAMCGPCQEVYPAHSCKQSGHSRREMECISFKKHSKSYVRSLCPEEVCKTSARKEK